MAAGGLTPSVATVNSRNITPGFRASPSAGLPYLCLASHMPSIALKHFLFDTKYLKLNRHVYKTKKKVANLPEIQTPICAFARTDEYRAEPRCSFQSVRKQDILTLFLPYTRADGHKRALT